MRQFAVLGLAAALIGAPAAASAQVTIKPPVTRTLKIGTLSTTQFVSAHLTLPANCDPNGQTLDKAEALNTQGKFDDAVALVNKVLAASPNDFRASYIKGKAIFLKASLVDPNRWNPPLPLSKEMAEAFDILRDTAATLPKQDQACAVATDAYSIYNTIGAFYLNRGYFKDAESYLLQAYANDKRVSDDTKRKIRDNLGLVYLNLLQPDQAIRYYQEAAAYHSTVAAKQLPQAYDLKRRLAAPLAK